MKLIAVAVRAVSAISTYRIRRALYYLRLGQVDIVKARVANLLKESMGRQDSLVLYFPEEIEGQIELPQAVSPKVSIIVPVFNHWPVTKRCLAAIANCTTTSDYEVILADDASSDATADAAAEVRGLRRIRNRRNLGFLENCNNAAKAARGQYLVFLNNDTLVQPGWLEALVSTTEADGSVGLVGPMFLNATGGLQEAGGIVWRDGAGWNYGRHDDPRQPEFNYLKDVDYVSGACVLVRRELWEKIGGFDTRFAPAYYEDTDLAFQVREAGYKVKYQPRARVIHLEGVSHGSDPREGVKVWQSRNQIKFLDKWRAVLDKEQGRDVRDLMGARDRSFSKRHLLFIDHYVPMPDLDAGSRATYQYLELMAAMGYQITLFPDNFVAYQPYTQKLQQLGIEVLYGSSLQRQRRRWLANNVSRFDYVYINRPHIADDLLPLIRKNGRAKILYCAHDLHCLRLERLYALERRLRDRNEARRWARIEGRVLSQADIAYFFSNAEVEEVRRRFPGATARVIPLFLFDLHGFTPQVPRDWEAEGELLFVGGFKHHPNVDGVTWFLDEILPLVSDLLPDVHLSVVGSDVPSSLLQRRARNVTFLGRLADEELATLYRKTRVVVAPLRFGAGIKGKIIEAMYHRVPVVTTSVGAEGICEDRQCLVVADSPGEFATEVVALYKNRKRCSILVDNASEYLVRHYSTDVARKILFEDMPI